MPVPALGEAKVPLTPEVFNVTVSPENTPDKLADAVLIVAAVLAL